MVPLGGKKQYCNNPLASSTDDVEKACRGLLNKMANVQCTSPLRSPRIQKRLEQIGEIRGHDIHRVVAIGTLLNACPYYGMWELVKNAEIFFCPYAYLINPSLRERIQEKLKGAIIVFDEAHNLEDVARDAGSIDLDEDTLADLAAKLQPLRRKNGDIYTLLHTVIALTKVWVLKIKKLLLEGNLQGGYSSWTKEEGWTQLRWIHSCMNLGSILTLVMWLSM